jgi:hypothetical protein
MYLSGIDIFFDTLVAFRKHCFGIILRLFRAMLINLFSREHVVLKWP